MKGTIRVAVESEYLPDQSEPAAGRYTFAYHVTIRNEGREPARLLARHWIITDGEGRRREVRGEGVVGLKPLIPPGESFRYSSFAVLETAVGTMEGSYQMVGADGRPFEAPIPPFRLAVPGAVN